MGRRPLLCGVAALLLTFQTGFLGQPLGSFGFWVAGLYESCYCSQAKGVTTCKLLQVPAYWHPAERDLQMASA